MRDKILSLEQGILDILVDDDESIIQIEKGLINLGIDFDRESVKRKITELLKSLSVQIYYPPNKTINDFWEAKDDTIGDFWFKLTSKGKSEWESLAKAYFNEDQ